MKQIVQGVLNLFYAIELLGNLDFYESFLLKKTVLDAKYKL